MSSLTRNTNTTAAQKIAKAASIKVLDGNRKKFKNFFQNIKVELVRNEETYKDNKAKILWVLTYLQEGTTAQWRDT